MRRGREPEVLKLDGKLYGFNLGADFVAEHEWGIKKTKNKFGIDLAPSEENDSILSKLFKRKPTSKPLLGVDKRTITMFPEENMFFDKLKIKNKTYWVLMFFDYLPKELKFSLDLVKNCDIYPYDEERHVFTAWNDGSFGILVDCEYKNELTELYDAFKRLDVVIMVGKGYAFENGGLLLLIRSSMPQEEIDKLYEADIDNINLKNVAKNTKIEEILKSFDKQYFSLYPRWKDDSKSEVVFWLNPKEQHIYNAGWYTVDELKQWTKNEGPVVKRK